MKFRKYVVGSFVAIALAALCLGGCGTQSEDPHDEEGVEETVAPDQEQEEDGESEPVVDLEDRDASSLSLKDAYADRFSIGVAVNSWQLADQDTLDVITKDFNSFTTENEMKPDYILDYNATLEADDGMPAINTERLDEIMTMAEDAGLVMRGHTLVWHSQTPEWLFYEDYDTSKDYASRETMLARMEHYIKSVMTFCQEEHPGVIYAWDVVNEAVSDSGGYRTDSPWYITIGGEYIEKAFEYASKYAADGVKLFYNDYNCTIAEKRKTIFTMANNLYAKGLIDGIGMQSHHDIKYFDVSSIEKSIIMFAEIGDIEIQLTELDFHYNDSSDEAMNEQAEKYKEIFDLLVDLQDSEIANITNVTFWGLNDGLTWLTHHKGEDSYPLLFDADHNAKPCYFSIFDAAQ